MRTIRRTVDRLDGYPDRSTWGPGGWEGEPDLIEWRNTDAPGLALMVVRSNSTGALCGYVGLPPGHPQHGKGDVSVEVHGGLTYADECAGHICHVPEPGEPDDIWWLGFDCGHCFDMMPAMEALVASLRELRSGFCGTYRTLDYVMNEVESLALQLAEVK